MIKCDQLPEATLKAIKSPRLSEGYNVYSAEKSISIVGYIWNIMSALKTQNFLQAQSFTQLNATSEVIAHDSIYTTNVGMVATVKRLNLNTNIKVFNFVCQLKSVGCTVCKYISRPLVSTPAFCHNLSAFCRHFALKLT